MKSISSWQIYYVKSTGFTLYWLEQSLADSHTLSGAGLKPKTIEVTAKSLKVNFVNLSVTECSYSLHKAHKYNTNNNKTSMFGPPIRTPALLYHNPDLYS